MEQIAIKDIQSIYGESAGNVSPRLIKLRDALGSKKNYEFFMPTINMLLKNT